MQNEKGMKALEDFRILDLTRVLAGPFATMVLADLGAEVIKIEIPHLGDDTRSIGPYVDDESMYFMNTNRNKKSMTLNLKAEEGQKVFLELVNKADVVIENFKPGVMEKLNLGFDVLKEHNPDIIYASISGFGHSSPYASRPGYDIIGQAMGGIMSCTGWPDSPPTRIGTAMGDILAGLFTTIGILSSLIVRNKFKKAQHVDVALVDSVISSMNTMIQVYLVDGKVPDRVGNRYLFMYPFDTFKTSDGWVVIGVGNDRLWENFCRVIGREDLLAVEKYATNSSRVTHYKELEPIVTEWTKERTVKQVSELLFQNGIPSSPVYDVKDIVNDNNIVEAREMLVEVDHPKVGKRQVVGSPIKLSGTPAMIEKAAPLLGEHTKQILQDILKYSESQVKELEANQIV